MNGVEILAMEEIVSNSIFNWSEFWIGFCAVLGITIAIGIIYSVSNNDWGYIVGCVFVGLFFGSFMGIIFGNASRIPTEYKTQYKIIISDDVSMNDFVDKYEIIDQEGRIFTVIEKE